MSKNQNWVRLGKNVSTLIVVIVIVAFFYVYKPLKTNIDVVDSNQDKVASTIQDSIVPLYDTIINPNDAQFDDFLRVGFSEKQAKSCINYRSKGGKFHKESDLMKIYSISENDYNRLKQYVIVPKENKTREWKREDYNKKEKHIIPSNTVSIKIVSINSCDTTDLMNLPKIGSFRARKIIEYRDKLGGFYDISQLLNVYSIDSELVSEIGKYIIVDTLAIKKINVNEASFKEIVHHPLISYETTKNIVTYKRIVGEIKNVQELRDNNIVSADEYETLKNYIKTF